jgi:hypothetical protein
MTDLPDPMMPTPDALADLKAQIESELAHGKYNEEQLAELREIQAEHAERLDDIVAAHSENIQSIGEDLRIQANEWSEEHAADIAAHHIEPRDMADIMQPIDAAAIDQVEARVDAASEVVELQIDTWREIVEWRAEQGGESPDVVEAQLAQLDEAEDAAAAIHEYHHEMFDTARHNDDIVMDDARDSNVPPSPTTIDAGDYHLAPDEHGPPIES